MIFFEACRERGSEDIVIVCASHAAGGLKIGSRHAASWAPDHAARDPRQDKYDIPGGALLAEVQVYNGIAGLGRDVNRWVRRVAARAFQDYLPMQPSAHCRRGTGPRGQVGGRGAGAFAIGTGLLAIGAAAKG
jgi:hypothetical protein